MYSIGLDIGTTSICAILMNNKTGVTLCSATKANEAFIKTEKPWEKIQDVGIITDTVGEVLENLLLNKPDDGKIDSLGISNQMHGILYSDKNGKAVSPLYIWQDERGNLPYRDGKSYAEYMGSFAGYGLVTDFYNRDNGLVPEEAVNVCTIGDYIAMQLCNKSTPLMHISNAASFGCFDIINNRFTIDNNMLPPVTADFCSVGEYRGIPVCTAVGDNQASFIGSVSGDLPLINVGTGSQVSYLSDTPVKGENIETRPYDGEKFLVVGSSLCGGRAFALLERFFASVAELATGEKYKSLYPQIDKMLAEKSETDMVTDSRFCGTRANPGIRASISSISENNFTAGDMAVSMLYAIADELLSMYGGKHTDYIVCSGNGIRKNLALQKVVSKQFGAEIRIPKFTEEASYGAALTSLIATGIYKNLSDAQKMIIYR